MFYFARSMNIICNSLLAQLVKCDVHTTRKIKSIHAIFLTYYYFLWPIRITILSSYVVQYNKYDYRRWWSGVVVARYSRSTKLTYFGPG